MIPFSVVLYPAALNALLDLGADYLATAGYPPGIVQMLSGDPDPWAAAELRRFLPIHATNTPGTLALPGFHLSVKWSNLRFLTQVIVQGPEELVLVGFERLLGRGIATEVERVVQAHWPQPTGYAGRYR